MFQAGVEEEIRTHILCSITFSKISSIYIYDVKFLALLGAACKGKGKAIPLRAWTGPEGSRRLRLPDFKTIGA
jgi:hypothetical protein